jgi:hypothetical protein
MTADDFRHIALGMADALESSHMGHPDFRVNGRIFATLQATLESGMVKLTPEHQHEFMRGHPGAFTPASGAWGREGCTIVRLHDVDEETVGEALTLAWQRAVAEGPVRSRRRKGPASRTRRSRPR